MSRHFSIMSTVTLLLALMTIACPVERAAAQIAWPVENTGNDHPLGNSFGEFQHYGGAPYLHTGIDIRQDCAPNGPFVRSVTAGTITLVDDSNDPTNRYNGVTIVTGNTTYRYWHLDHNSITNDVTNAVNNNTQFPTNTRISQIVDWTAGLGNFHHLHFDISRGTDFQNPFSEGMTPENDNESPEVIENEIYICRNNSNTFLTKPASGCWTVDGDLDIIARVTETDPPSPAINWQGSLGIYRIEYSIDELTGTGTHNVPTTQLYRFDNFPTAGNGNTEAGIIFKNTAPADSRSDYWTNGGERNYYIVTNVDNNGDLSEANGYWDTDAGNFPDGLYQISVKAYDFVGNHHTRSEIVYVKNSPSSAAPVEVVIRDRNGDTGAVPSNPNGERFWVSPDIRVDAPPLGVVNATQQPFGAGDHDNPVFGQQNRVYVRVHNIGCKKSGDVTVRLYWANPSGGIPQSAWNEIDPSTTKIVNDIPAGGSKEYDPPVLWIPTGDAIGHRCLLVRLESTEDPIESDYNVPGENNIGMKNVTIVNPAPGAMSETEFLITNPTRRPARIQLIIDRGGFPRGTRIALTVPFEQNLYNEIRNIRGINVAYKKEMLAVELVGKRATLKGLLLQPEEKLLAKMLIVLPERIDVRTDYSLDVTQIVNGKVTGGLTFTVPGICRKPPWKPRPRKLD